MPAKSKKETPLMKQYSQIKAKHPGALLLFRVGDFYEAFGEDAIKASEILNILLTKRSNGIASDIELAGFPHHSLDTYLTKLVQAGNRVAICEQLEDPKAAKGIVKRGVTELITPGLSMNDDVLDRRRNNYLAALSFGKDAMGISLLDLSTGEFMVSQGTEEHIDKLIQSFQPSEIIFCKSYKEQFDNRFQENYNTYCLEEWIFGLDYGYEKLTSHFKTANLKGFGIEEMREAICAAGAVLYYLEETEHKKNNHISSISRIETDRHVWLDKFTIRNLELLSTQQRDGTPLIDILDKTLTPMGARMLRKWMVLPLKDKSVIEERLSAVEALVDNTDLQEQLLASMKEIGDLERLISKVSTLRVNPKELVQLKNTLTNITPIINALRSSGHKTLEKFTDLLNPCEQLLEKITRELKDDAPILSNQGGLINEGVHKELDELGEIAYSGKDFLLQIQRREMVRTGIVSLKVAYNKVFGYYLEVSNAHKRKVPRDWIRKQTLVNAERYITEELKTYEEKILNAEERMHEIEQKLFRDLVLFSTDYVAEVQQNAKTVAAIDCLTSFAQTAVRNNYCQPGITEENLIDIKEGRHPVIEQRLPAGEHYIPNSVLLDEVSQQIMVITGPNMAGKSALLRQTALIVLMAQMGSFVPAAYAKVGIVDKVFTRVGAFDNLSKGESTFMVEMTETASILNNLSNRSLILMDEIGRGTSTYDGVSIAWSIIEYLHQHPNSRAKTMFATHYHELNQIAQDFPRVKNFNVSVKELDNRVIFMRKLKEGGSEHSFGIHVAQMAGMPNQVVLRASEILRHLKEDKIKEQHDGKIETLPKSNFQLSIFEADARFGRVIDLLNKIDVNTISPVEALMKLNEVKEVLKEKTSLKSSPGIKINPTTNNPSSRVSIHSS